MDRTLHLSRTARAWPGAPSFAASNGGLLHNFA